jgi:Arc/MetJ-type ribon-helix-helix transcriptional regulator
MSTLNVKIPDEMEEDLQDFLEENPHYLNKSEAVRDALRHLLNSQQLADWAREDVDVSRDQIAAGETVALDDLE